MGARNSEINIPARRPKHRCRRCMQRTSSPREGFACASRLGPGVCGAPCVAVHHHGAAMLVVAVTGAALVTPYRTIAIPQTNTNETNACTSPASPAFFPFDGLSDATRRRITRRSAVSAPRSQVGRPLATTSHRTPSPSVRPVTRERSPKRVLQVVCGWCTGACWSPRLGLECPGRLLRGACTGWLLAASLLYLTSSPSQRDLIARALPRSE